MSDETPISSGISDDRVEKLEPLVPVSAVDKSTLPVVSISPSKQKALSILGAERAKDGQGTIKQHERGILGEFAVAKYLGIPEQIDEQIYENGDDGYDIVFNGKLIDVKTVGPQVNNPFLPVSTYGELNADFYILVQQLNQSKYQIYGYAHRLLVKKSHTLTFTHNKLCSPDRFDDQVYAVEQDALKPIGRL